MDTSQYQDPVELLSAKGGSSVVPLRWQGGNLYLLDQRLLPREEVWLRYSRPEQVACAIINLVVRGAPAIGIAAAFGMVLAAMSLKEEEKDSLQDKWLRHAEQMIRARPTAVNLAWAVERMKRVFDASIEGFSTSGLIKRLEQEAMSIWLEDVKANLAMGEHGQGLFPEKGGVLTHCNAGALATGGYGTALGVIRAAIANGKKISVIADETRPWLQGARLTVYELVKDHIPVILTVDSASGLLMRKGMIRTVIVGADRIAANGDVANKIGTYNVAELARANDIPFFVAAPTSTLDLDTPGGDSIPIEERPPEEITTIEGKMFTVAEARVYNPVFDITPNSLISAIITEKGVLTPPYGPAISACMS